MTTEDMGRSQLDTVVETALADLAGRLASDLPGTEIDPADIDVVVAERVTWSDGSLGCPEPGTMYTQAIVDGFKVVLEYKARRYHYHAGSDGLPSLCPAASKDDPGPGTPEPSIPPPID